MSDTHSESTTVREDRLAKIEERMTAMEQSGMGPGVAARALRLLPLLALGNMFIAAPALIVSGAVAYFAFEQAEATKKMQIGSVWPNITYDTGNLGDAGEPQISFNVSNRGVGPARIGGMQLSLDDKAHNSIQSLLRECCIDEGERLQLVMTAVNGEVIQPGDEFAFVTIDPNGVSPDNYAAIEEVRMRIRTQICYCSVFDDCWIEDSQATTVEPVGLCPADWVQYGFPSGVKPGA